MKEKDYIERTLSQINKVETSPYLFTRIESKIQSMTNSKVSMKKVMIGMALTCFLIALNIVVTASSGFAVKLAANPAAITTIIVSPIAREAAKRRLPEMPGIAAGSITFLIVSLFVEPSAKEASRSDCGTAFITSSDSEEISGMIIIPIISPAANALSDETFKPTVSPEDLIIGATVNAAKNP